MKLIVVTIAIALTICNMGYSVASSLDRLKQVCGRAKQQLDAAETACQVILTIAKETNEHPYASYLESAGQACGVVLTGDIGNCVGGDISVGTPSSSNTEVNIVRKACREVENVANAQGVNDDVVRACGDAVKAIGNVLLGGIKKVIIPTPQGYFRSVLGWATGHT